MVTIKPKNSATTLSALDQKKKNAAENTPRTQPAYLITGDIGGTNSRMALYVLDLNGCLEKDAQDEAEDVSPTISKTFQNEEQYPSESVFAQDGAFVEYILKPFLSYCWDEDKQANDHEQNQDGDKSRRKTVKLPPITEETIITGCIACAGNVVNNEVRLTNLGNLLISGKQIEKDTSNEYMKSFVKCLVMNDFMAQGYGCLTLRQCEVKHLYGPDNLEAAKGPKVCVGAGTGLGECFLTQSQHIHCTEKSGSPQDCEEEPYSCFPSEGGHVEFSPHDQLEVELYQYLSQKFCTKDRISVERIVSGTGLANVYEFLAHKFPDSINPRVHEEFLKAGDEQGKVVALHAKPQAESHRNEDDGCALCQKAMSIMMTAYGYEVGSTAIKFIPTGGLFVSGGLTPKNIEFIEGLQTDFMIAYRNKGRVSPVLERVPLYAVMTEDLGVRGAHMAALVAFQSYCNAHQIKLVSNKNRHVSSRKQFTRILIGVAMSSAFLTAITSVSLTLFFHNRMYRKSH